MNYLASVIHFFFLCLNVFFLLFFPAVDHFCFLTQQSLFFPPFLPNLLPLLSSSSSFPSSPSSLPLPRKQQTSFQNFPSSKRHQAAPSPRSTFHAGCNEAPLGSLRSGRRFHILRRLRHRGAPPWIWEASFQFSPRAAAGDDFLSWLENRLSSPTGGKQKWMLNQEKRLRGEVFGISVEKHVRNPKTSPWSDALETRLSRICFPRRLNSPVTSCPTHIAHPSTAHAVHPWIRGPRKYLQSNMWGLTRD